MIIMSPVPSGIDLDVVAYFLINCKVHFFAGLVYFFI